MEELRPWLALLGLAVVVGAAFITVARARGWRFAWWERIMSAGRVRPRGVEPVSVSREQTPARPAARTRRPSAAVRAEQSARSGAGAEAGGRAAGQTALHLEDVPLLDPREGSRAAALDREFELGDLGAMDTGAEEAPRPRPAPPVRPAPRSTGSEGEPRRKRTPGPEREPETRRGPPPKTRPAAEKARRARPESREAPASEPAPEGEELLVVLTVMTPGQRQLSGERIRQALTAFGLEPDEVGLFHHFGSRRGRAQQSVFSVANVLEPGMFDIERMQDLETPGLCIFMRRPGPFPAAVAFDLMVDVGSRLARTLEAVLCDQQRCRLTPQATQALRERVVHFALRHERRPEDAR